MNKIYCITNNVNDKKYVGFTSVSIGDRMSQHKHKSKKSKFPIHQAIQKYGWDKFSVSVLYEGDDALEKEDDYIQKYGDYNIANGGSAPMLGKKWTEEQKKNVKGKIGKARYPAWNRGKKLGPNPEHSRKMRKPDNEVSSHALYMREYRKKIKG